ncbi:sporulation protein YlmC with PRC-barrel domain [Janthinobacterium sp. CG_23.3]|uniref:PRC-barrel domain-containing protein n=1 Tax=unclassified Janthinobacterium TaxID=2610881 RepID=UPI000345C8AC|nr:MULTISPECIES: PRC-barrel domain-containing protein [unclassified Janthinobacterium]MEC5161551.1 sporulation protein YlmC with PRC-barrel domain [Janthinobacterium sp. CG_S6]
MTYMDRDTLGMYKGRSSSSGGPGPELMGSGTLVGEDVYNHKEQDLGDIKEIMLDMRTGEVAYAVLSFGGILGMGEKLFAVPWESLTLDTVNKRFLLDIDKDQLKTAPGFDKDHWPDMTSEDWAQQIRTFYGTGSRSGAAHSGRSTSGAGSSGGIAG